MAKTKDGIIVGGLFGLAITTPKIATWVTDKLAELIPLTWQVFGDFSIAIFGVAIGMIIGFVTDST